ncbi:WD40 repeat domain-containing protein [Natronoglomus mannanivorans]|uniref:PQQ-binding-like beta-propeller repeat protein n=1 Tax=Natronoglomus mannanivorans TaxID=2979990 RepID=A0AAP3E1K6_9EURY|nr:PQQ-binding-like beta-propeller repeat protein [Halobacteria archaeon AArc-xg1-1]
MSSTEADLESTPQPMPTAHEVVPGCTLDRRTFLQGAAGAGAAAIGGAASSGTVAADDDDYGLVDGLRETIPFAAASFVAAGPAGLAIYTGALALRLHLDDINTDPSSDRVILHQLVDNEVWSLNRHFVNFGNHMQDSRPVASLEARHGMASAWELGEGASAAYDTALQRIRQYYELPEFNNLHGANKHLLQLSYIAGSGQETDPAYNIQTVGEDESGESVIVRITDEREEVELTLHDGTVLDENAFDDIEHIDAGETVELADDEEVSEGAFYTPVFDIIDAADEETVLASLPIDQGVIDSFDSNGNEEVTFTDDDGNEYTTDLRLQTQNVEGSDDDSAMESQLAFDAREWLRLHHKVIDLSDTVAAQYDQSFVEDIYDELEAGNITPEQVRSPEGMARFLSGTDDPESERFQIAWMQQFGFERPDMSLVRGMDVTWSGATETWVDPDPNLDDRHTYPSGHVDEQDYTGVVFGSDLPDGGFQSGNRYTVGSPLYTGAYDDEVHAVDSFTGDLLWSYEHPSEVSTVEASRDGQSLFATNRSDEMHVINTADGSTDWVFDGFAGQVYGTELSPDEETLYLAAYEDGIRAIDLVNETEAWTHGTDTSESYRQIGLSVDGETLYLGDGTGVTTAIAVSDQSEQWTNSGHSNALEAIVSAPDDSTIYTSAQEMTVQSIDTETGETGWTYDGHANSVTDLAIDPSGESVYTASVDDEVHALDASDGSVRWTYTQLTDTVRAVTVSPDGQTVYAAQSGEDIHAIDAETGTQKDGFSYHGTHTNTIQEIAMAQPEGIDGVAARSVIFDESTEDRDGEGQVDLWNGVLEINEMWDAEGATITHVTDETIGDIEEVTGEDIDTIVEEMDEFDDVDDIRFTRDVKLILEHYGVEDELENVHREEQDYSTPEYDSFDSSEFAARMESLEEMVAQLEDQDDDDGSDIGLTLPGGWPSADDLGSAALGVAIIGVVVMALVGIVTDLLPWN